MNKTELVDSVHDKAGGVDKKDVAAVVDAFIDVVQDAVANDDKVTLPGFGSLSRLIACRTHGSEPAHR